MSNLLKVFLTACFLFLQIYLSAQDKTENYIQLIIPDSLTKGAEVVCRLDEKDVEIISPGKILVRKKRIYSILNNNAEEYSNYYAHYNKLWSINSVNGTLYNSVGKEIRHIKKKDMSDFPGNGEAFVSDDRIKMIGLSYHSYPYTVEFEEENEAAGALYIPDWGPPRSDKMSVVISRYILTVPVDYKFRYRMINTDIKPEVIYKKDKITYKWEIRNLPVMPDEPFSISSDLYDPAMLVGPTEFETEGYKGNMTAWQDYGKFYYSLYKGKDLLPEDLKLQVHQLADHLNDPYKKIAILYDYLQKNTHYVLIMFGIGGLQPFDATYVARNKYGDCKALSNFMVALLKEAGIKGYPVTIWGGEEERAFYVDFPSHQSNHIICAIPLNKDTVWLECTDQYLPAGYLGSFTQNRYGLMIDEKGGTLVHTPVYGLKDNTSIRKIKSIVDAEGNLQIKSETSYRAMSQDPVENISHHYSKDKQLEYLKQSFNLPTYTVNSFNYNENYLARIPSMQESLDISVTNYAQVTGKRMFINPNILRRSKIKFSKEKERKLDFQFNTENSEIDSVEILLPGGYEAESVPGDKSLSSKFGQYQTHTIVRSDKILYYRKFDLYRGRFQASVYEEIETFYNGVYDADHTQIVLVKKTKS